MTISFDSEKLSIKSVEMDDVLKDADLLATVRRLTLGGNSGMNVALDYYLILKTTRSVRAHAIIAYHDDEAIGWALLTRESDKHSFQERIGHACIQVYVARPYRRNGVGCSLLKTATELYEDTIHVYEWSEPKFFSLFMGEKNFKSVED
jgi:GNAT superfamily N-acetyltransferase